MVFSRDIGVGRHDLNPQNSTLFLRFKSDTRLDLTKKSLFLDGHYLGLTEEISRIRIRVQGKERIGEKAEHTRIECEHFEAGCNAAMDA